MLKYLSKLHNFKMFETLPASKPWVDGGTERGLSLFAIETPSACNIEWHDNAVALFQVRYASTALFYYPHVFMAKDNPGLCCSTPLIHLADLVRSASLCVLWLFLREDQSRRCMLLSLAR